MSELKLGRHYRLSILFPGGQNIIITDPITLEFDITRNVLTSANVCQLRIYNLSKVNRTQLRYNFDNLANDRQISLQVGYGSNLFTIFSGNMSQAWSVREGNNFITQIECFDGGFAIQNGKVILGAGPWPAGIPMETIYKALISDLPGISFGGISTSFIQNANGLIKNPSMVHFDGEAYNVLQELTNKCFYIDQQKAYIVSQLDYFVGSITQIDASTGLLGTPLRETTIVDFDMLLEPSLTIGQQIKLISSTTDDDNINGVSKIVSLKHRGMISGSVCGDAITTVGFFYGTQGGQPVNF